MFSVTQTQQQTKQVLASQVRVQIQANRASRKGHKDESKESKERDTRKDKDAREVDVPLTGFNPSTTALLTRFLTTV